MEDACNAGPTTAKTVSMGRGGTLGPLVARFLVSRRSQGRYNAKSVRVVGPRLRTLDEHFGRRPITHLTRKAIERWLESLERLSTNSRASYMASVRQFTAWLVLEGHLVSDPCVAIPNLKRARSVPRSLASTQVAAVLAACENDRDRVMIWLEVGMGLRRGEVSAATWEDYNERDRVLLVHGKGQRERLVPVIERAASAMAAIRGATTGPIVRSFVDPSSGLLADTVGARVSQLFRLSGVKRAPYDGMSGHALRHTCATDVLDACGDPRVVQELLGHDNLATTSIYVGRASRAKMRQAMEGRDYSPTGRPFLCRGRDLAPPPTVEAA